MSNPALLRLARGHLSGGDIHIGGPVTTSRPFWQEQIVVRSNASSYHNEARSESMTKKVTPMKTKKEKTDSSSDSESGSEDEGGMKKKKAAASSASCWVAVAQRSSSAPRTSGSALLKG